MKKVKAYIFILLTALLLVIETPLLQAQDAPAVSRDSVADTIWTVRVSSFQEAANAWAFMDYLKDEDFDPTLVRLYDSRGKLWRVVQIGDYPTKSQAQVAGTSFKQRTGLDYLIRSMSLALLERRRADSPETPIPANQAGRANNGVEGKSYGQEGLLGAPEEFFFELDEQDVLRAISNQQRNVILARIMIRRGAVESGIKTYEKLVKQYADDLDLREEYIAALIDNEEFNKAEYLLKSWISDDPSSPRALRQVARLRLLVGDYSVQQETLNYLLRLRPGDIDSLSSKAYSREQAGDWLGAINSFSELIDAEPDNVDARMALSGLLMQRRPRIELTPSVYLQPNDTITTTYGGRFSMQLSHLIRGEIYYDNTSIYRPAGDGIEKIDKTVNRAAFLFHRDFSRTFTGILGVGAYEGTSAGGSVALGFDWRVHDPGLFSLMIDYNNPWLDEPSAANYEGRYNQLSLTYNGFYDDKWGLFLNGQIRQYKVDDDRLYGTKGIYNIILTRKLLSDPEVYASYSFYRSHFKYDDENFTPFTLVEDESIHTMSTSLSKSLCDTVLLQASGGIRLDEFKNSPSYFGGPSVTIRLGRVEFNAGYEYSSDSGLAGGGETQLITGGFSYVF